MKKFFSDKRIVLMYLITIIFLIIGTTYALSSNSMALGLTTAIVKVDETAYGSTTFDSSELEFIPILDSEVETNKENVIHIDFKVGGAESNNNDNIIYDIALKDLDVNCKLLSPYIKWKLVKNGEEISNGSLDPKFDSIDEYGRLVLTTTQQDLVDYNEDKTVYDDYSFYMWFSDSCQSDLLTCMNSGIVDQSGLLGQNLSGKIEVELYTENKKELVRVPEGEKDEEGNVAISYCNEEKYFATLELNGGTSDQNIVIIENGKISETLPTPTRTDEITFDTNGGTTDNTSPQSITYTFEGWYLDKSFQKVVTSGKEIEDYEYENITLYAKWSNNNQISLPDTTKTGYEFLGWYRDFTLNNLVGNSGDTYTGDTYTVDGSQTLYAKWKSNAYLVTYNSGNLLYGLNDISTTSDTRMNYSISSGVVTVTATADDGYGFTTGRFYLEAGKEYIFKATSSGTWGVTSGSDTVEAYFMKDGTYSSDIPLIHPDTGTMNSSGEFIFTPTVTGTYWLRLDVNLSGTTHTFTDISVSYNIDSSEVNYGRKYGEMPAITNTGHTLLGWYTEMNGGTQITSDTLVDIIGEHTLYANWTPNTYNLNYYNNLVANGDLLDGANGWTLSNYAHRELVSTATAVRVTSTGTGVEGFTTSYKLDYKTSTKYRITLKAYRASTSTYGDLTKDFRVYLPEYNSSGTLLTYNHYISINSSNLPDATWKEFTAEFTTRSDGSYFGYLYLDYYGVEGTSTIWIKDVKVEEVQSSTREYGSFLGTLPTVTRTGYTFKGWYTGEEGTGSQLTTTTLMPANDYNGYASWTANSNTLTVNPNGGSFNGTTGVSTFNQESNSIRVIPKPTRSGYDFAGWTISGNGILHRYGTSLYTDEYFSSGTNSMNRYDNGGNGVVTLTRIATTSDNPIKNATYMMQIQTAGSTWPGLGGFVQNTTSKANGIFYHVIIAKIPVGYTINQANNSTGTNGSFTWLTSQEGTGQFETYIYRANNGSSGTFSTFGHVYLKGAEATSSSPVVWYVAYANMFDATDGTADQDISQVFDYNKGGATTITANWSTNSYYFDVNKTTGVNTFTISGGVNSGSGLADYYYSNSYGTTFTISSVTASTGYHLTGNTISGTTSYVSGYSASSTTTIKVTLGAGAGAINLIAAANTYTVAYNCNNGTGSTASSSHTYGAARALTTNGCSRKGYTFLGWSTSSTAESATYTNGQSVTNLTTSNGVTITLYAVWRVNNYQISSGSATYANTLANAISWANAGATITLLNSITDSSSGTISKNITFDTNGNTLTREAVITINSGVTVTMKGSGNILGSSSYTGYLINNAGTLTITGGGGYASVSSTATIYTSGTFTLTNGNVLNAGGSSSDSSKANYNAIRMVADAGTTKLVTGNVYSKWSAAVRIMKLKDSIVLGSSSGTYSKTAIRLYGYYVAVYGPAGTPGSRASITWYNGSMFSVTHKWVASNIDENPKRSCSFNSYANAPSKSYTLPALTIGSYSVAQNKATYQIWLAKSTSNTAACTN